MPPKQDDAADRKRVYGDIGTMYAACGGVFGVSAFVDKCMDKWMADPTLNSNEAVRMWHESAQRPGFKFLVVQIINQLTGGPQVYTGRPMEEAHKHLNITEDQWGIFMELFNEVCEEFKLTDDMVGGLNALLISMEEECVIQPGERVPPNPGPARPRGTSLYARIGGVYPVALFSDRLVDALLADDRIQIPQDDKRNEASLKYLFTELVCSACGGPEVRTAKDFNETKLLIPKSQWQILTASASSASDHLPAGPRAELLQVLQRARNEIVDPFSDDSAVAPTDLGAAQVKTLQSAAAGVGLAAAARARRAAAGVGASVAARQRVLGDPRTLYGRGGGVFGLAKLTDRLMDTWMNNAALNANASVAKWHESQQKSGFKFLVTQLLGYLTGGPQRYTGQSMEASHKHLGISQEQWQVFVADAQRVFNEVQLQRHTQRELMSIIEGFQQQCTVQPGETPPPDPGMCRRKPDGSTNYAHLGGVYPVAMFVDRLVEAVIRGDRVQVQWDQLDSPGIRHPPGLRYMLTELLCNSLGGPELVTSKGFEEAKLGINPDQWAAFVQLAGDTASIWPTQRHRELILQAIEKEKVHICVGLVAEDGEQAARRALAEAGYGVVEQAAALDHCGGDVAKALDLLRSGWTPERRMIRSNSDSTLASGAPTEVSRCPFSSAMSSAGAGYPARRSSNGAAVVSLDATSDAARVLNESGVDDDEICELLGIDANALESALAHDRFANAARVLFKRKVPLATIADKLNMAEARVHTAVQAHAAHAEVAGRTLGNSNQMRLDELLVEDPDLCCPISLCLFRDPVIASDGYMYECDSIKTIVRNRQPSPMTREALTEVYFPSRTSKSQAIAYREKRSAELLKFAEEVLAESPSMANSALDRIVEYVEVLKASQVPAIANKAKELFQKLGRPPPRELA